MFFSLYRFKIYRFFMIQILKIQIPPDTDFTGYSFRTGHMVALVLNLIFG